MLASDVVSLHYRAPELLLESTRYSYSIDMWSLGCVLAEMLTGQILFRGTLVSKQLDCILAVLGTPSEEECPTLHSKSAARASHIKGMGLLAAAPGLHGHPVAADLIGQLLAWDPARRPSAAQVLEHPFFSSAGDHELHRAPEAEAAATGGGGSTIHDDRLGHTSGGLGHTSGA